MQNKSVIRFLRTIGKKGGQATKEKYGPEHYKKLGELGRKGWRKWRRKKSNRRV